MTKRLPKLEDLERSQVDSRYTWDDKSIFDDIEAWNKEFNAILASLNEIRSLGHRIQHSPSELADVLEAVFDLKIRFKKVYVYAFLFFAVDRADQDAGSRIGQVQSLAGQFEAAASFLEPLLLELGHELLSDWVLVEPRLETYQHYFDNIVRKKPHIRTAEVEELLGLLSEPFSGAISTFGVLTDADFQFSPIYGRESQELPITQSTIDKHLKNWDRKVRKNAWENYLDIYLGHKHTLTTNLSTSVRQNVFEMRARNYPSTLSMALSKDNIPVEVYFNLLDAFDLNVAIWHRYWSLRKRILGIKNLRTYDIWAPLVKDSPEIPFEQAVEWIAQALMPLGDSYADTIRRGCLQERWVDVYPNKGKTGGAFSSGTLGTHPFIVLNFNNDALSLGILAHELGHSMHSHLTWSNQPPVYADYSLFAAEVASNFHQAMLRAYLLQQDIDRGILIGIIEAAMANFHRYFLVMPTLARFELEIHQQVERGETLTADGLITLHSNLLAKGYGNEMAIDQQRDGIGWATYGHLYEDYYVYQYVTGIAGASALANRIISGETDAVEDYLSFLKAGSSMYPIEALKMAGVDLSQTKVIETAFKSLSGLIDKLEVLV